MTSANDQRTGYWSSEEQAYLDELITQFMDGSLVGLRKGTTLRAFLANQLNCNEKRISKRAEKIDGYNGRTKYMGRPFSLREIKARKDKLDRLRTVFLDQVRYRKDLTDPHSKVLERVLGSTLGEVAAGGEGNILLCHHNQYRSPPSMPSNQGSATLRQNDNVMEKAQSRMPATGAISSFNTNHSSVAPEQSLKDQGPKAPFMQCIERSAQAGAHGSSVLALAESGASAAGVAWSNLAIGEEGFSVEKMPAAANQRVNRTPAASASNPSPSGRFKRSSTEAGMLQKIPFEVQKGSSFAATLLLRRRNFGNGSPQGVSFASAESRVPVAASRMSSGSQREQAPPSFRTAIATSPNRSISEPGQASIGPAGSASALVAAAKKFSGWQRKQAPPSFRTVTAIATNMNISEPGQASAGPADGRVPAAAAKAPQVVRGGQPKQAPPSHEHVAVNRDNLDDQSMMLQASLPPAMNIPTRERPTDALLALPSQMSMNTNDNSTAVRLTIILLTQLNESRSFGESNPAVMLALKLLTQVLMTTCNTTSSPAHDLPEEPLPKRARLN
ncbi:expressed unknown protein [Seminavis robusta]|uniref:Uncharacterized protein n=1 Tax=Seminavis robusta TaxID=568900 RepID=A0A9N8E619_9STRA|nr:expressed unknown protein [Seminavis robusta]|eukprot:Sro553_g165290.1 n/a (558) ;mRNA; r:19258-20931